MMKNRILRVAAPLGMPVTTRRVSGGLLIWRSSKEDLQQAQALTARRQTATPAPQCPRRQRTTPRRLRAARHTRSDPLDKWGRWGPTLQFVGAKPTIHRRNSRAAAALSRGVLRWIRLPAGKRAVWVGFQAAHVRTPPPSVSDEEGVFLWRALLGLPCFGPSPLQFPSSVSRQPGKPAARLPGPHWQPKAADDSVWSSDQV
jgi:hypothetical protein